MKVFVTGATGFIGQAVVDELMSAGHTVSALARTDAAAKALQARGIQPTPGSLDNLSALKAAARAADGAIHLAYMHGLGQVPLAGRLRIIAGGLPGGIVSRFMAVAAEADSRAIDTIARTFKGSQRPLVTTFGVMGVTPATGLLSRPMTEADGPHAQSPGLARARNEAVVEGWAAQGVRATMVRLAPTVHGEGDTGFIPQLIGIAGKNGHAAYVGGGDTRWSAVHRRDAARLFRLALEKGSAGARYHGVAEDGIAFKAIAGVIGQNLGVPVTGLTPKQAERQLSFLARFVATDAYASSAQTQAALDWHPHEPGLLSDLENAGYFKT